MAFPGSALEALIERERRLEQQLVDARTSVEGLRAVAKTIEQIHSGLYGQLQRLQYEINNFKRGNALVNTALRKAGG